ncbi:MAG: FAD-dependent monooxygenase [Cellvibrionaceae bacterium]
MRGIIVGAGMGGLSTAIALKAKGVSVDVFEAAQTLSPIGAGILVPPNAMAVLDQYKLADKVSREGYALERLLVSDIKGAPINSMNADYTIQGKQYSTIAIHRHALQHILLTALGNDVVNLGHVLQEVKESSTGVEASFKNGSTIHGDFLVGADGLRSAVRKTIFPESVLRYSGQLCWRGIADMTLPKQWSCQFTEVWGNGTRFGFTQINSSQVYWYATQYTKLDRHSGHIGLPQLLEMFKHYAPIVNEIICNTAKHSLIINSLYDLAPLKRWSQNAITLLGDAAHAATPNLGQGGAQAIEDSYALAENIANYPSLSTAFEHFYAERNVRVNKITKLSWQIGRLTNMSNPYLCFARNALSRHLSHFMSARQVQQIYDWR